MFGTVWNFVRKGLDSVATTGRRVIDSLCIGKIFARDMVDMPHFYTDATFLPRADVSLVLLSSPHRTLPVVFTRAICIPPDLDVFQ